jgi:type I restriction enzyme, S subunit
MMPVKLLRRILSLLIVTAYVGATIVKADCFRFRCHPVINKDYLHGWLNSPQARQSFVERSHGIGRLRINLRDYRVTPVLLPPDAEQRRIVAKLDSLCSRSKRARAEIERTSMLMNRGKLSILSKAFAGELTEDWRSGHPRAEWSADELRRLGMLAEDYLQKRRGSRLSVPHQSASELLGRIPSSWKVASLAQLGTLQVGYAFKSNWYSTEGVRLLRGANIAPGQLTWADAAFLPPVMVEKFTHYRVRSGDIVIAMDRPLISGGLKAALVPPEDDGCLLVQRVGRYVPGDFAEPIWQ